MNQNSAKAESKNSTKVVFKSFSEADELDADLKRLPD